MRQDHSRRAIQAKPAVERLDDRLAPAVSAGSAVGSVAGGDATLFKADGTRAFTVRPFGDGYAGGIRATTGDLNGDGTGDLIVAPGRGASMVVGYDGKTGKEIARFLAFERTFTGGANVAAADFTGDGKAEVVVAADSGGGPRVKVVSWANGAHTVADFWAYDDPNFRGGARVSVGDVNADGTADLVTAAGPGGGPRIAGFDGKSLAAGTAAHLFPDFIAFDPGFRGGASVAATTGGFAVGAGMGGSGRVQSYSYASMLAGDFTPDTDIIVGSPNLRSGANLAVKADGSVISTDPVSLRTRTVLTATVVQPPAATVPPPAPAAPPTSPPPPAGGGGTDAPDTPTTPPAAVAAGPVAPPAGPVTGANGQIIDSLKGVYTGGMTVIEGGNTFAGTGTIWVDDVRPRAGSNPGTLFDFIGVEVATVNGVAQPPRTIRGVYVSTTPPGADGTGQTGLFYPDVVGYGTPTPATDTALDWKDGVISLSNPIPGVAVSGRFTKAENVARDPSLPVLHLPSVGAKPSRADAAPWDLAAIDAAYARLAGTYQGTLQVAGSQATNSTPVAVDLTVSIDKQAPANWLAAEPDLIFRGTYQMKVGNQPSRAGDLVVNLATSTVGAADGSWTNLAVGFQADGTSLGLGAIAFTDPANPITPTDVRTVISGGPLQRV